MQWWHLCLGFGCCRNGSSTPSFCTAKSSGLVSMQRRRHVFSATLWNNEMIAVSGCCLITCLCYLTWHLHACCSGPKTQLHTSLFQMPVVRSMHGGMLAVHTRANHRPFLLPSPHRQGHPRRPPCQGVLPCLNRWHAADRGGHGHRLCGMVAGIWRD